LIRNHKVLINSDDLSVAFAERAGSYGVVEAEKILVWLLKLNVVFFEFI